MHITHRFIPGLRFEDVLVYQTWTPAGQANWEQLPLDHATPEDHAGQGAWWCARRCAAVLLRQPWRAVQLRPHLPAHLPQVLDADDVARVLECLLPDWPVVCHDGTVQNPVMACAPALLDGGSALLLIQSRELDSNWPQRFWTWVVGLETRCERTGRSTAGAQAWIASRGLGWGLAQADGPEQVQALLAMPFGWPMPWSCGYAARVQMNRNGLCDVGGISGGWQMGRCLSAIVLSPPAAPP